MAQTTAVRRTPTKMSGNSVADAPPAAAVTGAGDVYITCHILHNQIGVILGNKPVAGAGLARPVCSGWSTLPLLLHWSS